MDICLQISYELMLNNPADKPRWISALIHLSCQRNHHINDHTQVTRVSVDLLCSPVHLLHGINVLIKSDPVQLQPADDACQVRGDSAGTEPPFHQVGLVHLQGQLPRCWGWGPNASHSPQKPCRLSCSCLWCSLQGLLQQL